MTRRSRAALRDPITHLGAMLAATAALGLLLAGSVRPWQLAVLHLLVGGTAVLALRLPDATLSDTGRALRWASIALLPAMAIGAGLLLLPPAVLGVFAPGVLRAFPDGRWHTLSLVPEATASQLALALLVLAWGLLVGVWASARRERHEGLVQVFVWGTGALVVFAFAHALTGARSVLGILPVAQLESIFFAPLVNPNHLGTVLLLTFPLVLGTAWAKARSPDPLRWAYGAIAVGAAVLIVAILSPGVWMGLAGMGVAWLLIEKRATLTRLIPAAGITAVGAGIAVLLARHAAPGWWRSAVEPRLQQWGDLPALFGDFWLAGTGGGAYGAAYPSYRSLPEFVVYSHVHSDWMEWAVETGALGLLAGVVALWLFSRWPKTEDWRNARLLVLGLLGVLLHVAVEFSLQIPAVLLLFVAVLVVRYAGYGAPERVDPGRARQWILVAALLQVPLFGWQVRTHVVDAAVDEVRTTANHPAEGIGAARTVARLAPWRAEARLHGAWLAHAQGEPQEALALARSVAEDYPHDPHALRQAAGVIARAGHPEEALGVLERAIERDPNDFRTWAFVSRLARDTDPDRAVEAWAQALRHWPYPHAQDGAPLAEGYRLLPVGLWWLEALVDAPAHWSAYLGGILVAAGDPDTALLAFDQAAEKDRTYRYWPPRARALAGIGEIDQAERYLAEILERRPASLEARWVLAELLEREERWEDAHAAYLEVHEREPRLARAKVGAIRAAERAHGAEAGLAMADRLVISGRGDPQTRLEMARLHLASNRASECLRIIDNERLVRISATRDAADALRGQCIAACQVCGGDR